MYCVVCCLTIEQFPSCSNSLENRRATRRSDKRGVLFFFFFVLKNISRYFWSTRTFLSLNLSQHVNISLSHRVFILAIAEVVVLFVILTDIFLRFFIQRTARITETMKIPVSRTERPSPRAKRSCWRRVSGRGWREKHQREVVCVTHWFLISLIFCCCCCNERSQERHRRKMSLFTFSIRYLDEALLLYTTKHFFSSSNDPRKRIEAQRESSDYSFVREHGNVANRSRSAYSRMFLSIQMPSFIATGLITGLVLFVSRLLSSWLGLFKILFKKPVDRKGAVEIDSKEHIYAHYNYTDKLKDFSSIGVQTLYDVMLRGLKAGADRPQFSYRTSSEQPFQSYTYK